MPQNSRQTSSACRASFIFMRPQASRHALSTGSIPGDVNVIGTLSALVMEKAVVKAVRQAASGWDLPGLKK
jgi:hypothetical protein